MTTDPHGAPTPGPVVVGVDASPHAQATAIWAAAEADRRGTALRIVHAASTEHMAFLLSREDLASIDEAGLDLLARTEQTVRGRFPQLGVVTEYSRLQPVAALRAAAGTDSTIVVGTRGQGGFPELMLGSVTLTLAAHAPVPVIIVRSETDRPDSAVVAAAVRGENEFPWVRFAAVEAQLRRATLRLVSVWNTLPGIGTAVALLENIDELAHKRAHKLQRLADRIRHHFPDLTVDAALVSGNSIAAPLVEATATTDLLVAGGRKPAADWGPAPGRVVHTLLHHARCPVEIVHRGDGQEGPESPAPEATEP